MFVYSYILLLINFAMCCTVRFSLAEQFVFYKGVPIGILFAWFLYWVYLFTQNDWVLVSILNIFSFSAFMLWVNNIDSSQFLIDSNLIFDYSNYWVAGFIFALTTVCCILNFFEWLHRVDITYCYSEILQSSTEKVKIGYFFFPTPFLPDWVLLINGTM
jgi:hypothetical protein